MQMKCKIFASLGKQPNFLIQVNNKIVKSSLLRVENIENRHVCLVPLFKRFHQYFYIPH